MEYFIQNLGNSKHNVVRIIREKGSDVLLQNVFDGFVYVVAKVNFDKFYEKYEFTDETGCDPDLKQLDAILKASSIGKIKEEMDL